MLVKLLLERENYEVVEAANGVDAVNIGLRERPDLTLMDLNMPGLDGYEAIQRLRSAGGAAATMPIVVLTAEEGPTVEQRVLQLGADDYIQKPFDAAMLVSRVNAAFSRIRMHAA
jgi:DNA-binding response OmpR family regulator